MKKKSLPKKKILIPISGISNKIILIVLLISVISHGYSQKINNSKWRILNVKDSTGTEIDFSGKYCFTLKLPKSSGKKKLVGWAEIEDCNKQNDSSYYYMYKIKTILFKLNYTNKRIMLTWEGHPANGKYETSIMLLDDDLYIHFMNIFMSYGTYEIKDDKLTFELYTFKNKYKNKYYKVVFQRVS